MKISSIAPCGMNCNLCMAYLREKNTCPGCRDLEINTIKQNDSRKRCIIRNCEFFKKGNHKYCSPKCEKYPCRRLKQLDKRYSTKYGMSMIENLEMIDERGIRVFIANEKKRWIKDGRIFCVHRKEYFDIKP
jgi:hypothetical protein